MRSDGNPSFSHLWAVMDFHPKSLVMDIHAPSRLFMIVTVKIVHVVKLKDVLMGIPVIYHTLPKKSSNGCG